MSKNDKDIIATMREDAEIGLRLLMARYREPLYWHIRRLVVRHDDAQDAAQNTFIRIFRSFSQYNGNHSLTAWIYRIATNEALRLIERRGNDTMPLEKVSKAEAENYIDYSDLETVRLQKAILTLPPKQQLTFNLRYYDEMDYGEIAAIADTTPASAKANYYHAKEKIIKYMQSSD
ncbi:MAG: RNA polymerase sigma factor [Prevotella sp.]|nr:RNA polymerase sigma factor [Prevotella sp.]